MSEEALRQIALQVRNWGKWGPDDELGTLNYITPERIAAACRLATTGKVFALGIPLDRKGPQSGTRQRFNPIHTMFRDGGDAPKTPAEVQAMEGYGGSDDWIVMPLQCVTQWDSLAHIFYEGKMYNGYDAALVTSSGAAKNSIDKTKSRLAGRGVLLDVARHRRGAAQRGALARAGLRHHRRRSRSDRRRRAGRGAARRPPPRPDRPHVTLSRQERLAALRSRSVPRRLRAHGPVAARQADRGHRLRQLCGGGPPLGDHGLSQSLPRRGDPEHGAHAG
jgi:hypothetical protein